jgi:predicted nucleic acid-binding protein
MKIVTDTSPLHYLVLIDAESILPNLFASVMTPPEVIQELAHPRAPAKVRAWANALPPWLHVVSSSAELPDAKLGPGESAAIALALEVGADALLIDERDGTNAARRLGISTAGTLGLLATAAENKLVSLEKAYAALRQTSFRAPHSLMNAIIEFAKQRDARTERH